MVWLPDSEKKLMIGLRLFSLTEQTNVTDTRAGGQMGRDCIPRLYIASRGKNSYRRETWYFHSR